MSEDLSMNKIKTQKQIVVGYLLSKEKEKKLNFVENISKADVKNQIKLVKIEPVLPLSTQKFEIFDLIIHRIHDSLDNLLFEDREQFLNEFVDISLKLNIKLIDSLEIINLLTDRKKCMDILSFIENEKFVSFNFKVVPTIQILQNSSASIVKDIIYNIENNNFNFKTNIQFPIILKSTKCTFINQERYKMSILFNNSNETFDEILKFTKFTPIVIQPFYNHDGVLYKIFILGDKWHIVARKSIKNFDLKKFNQPIYFESCTISKKNSNSFLHNNQNDFNFSVEIVENKDFINCKNKTFLKQDIEKLIKLIKNVIPAKLLGIDLLIESNTKNLILIDINYFPGYDEIYNIGESFINLFNLLKKN